MGILSGYLKTKRYRKEADGNYILQSEWASSDTVEFPNGNTLTDEIELHTHNSRTINPCTIEFAPPKGSAYGGVLDFHYSGSTEDYTSRIIETSSGTLSVSGNMNVGASTDYLMNQLRNIVLIPNSSDPGANVETGYANGSIIFTYE